VLPAHAAEEERRHVHLARHDGSREAKRALEAVRHERGAVVDAVALDALRAADVRGLDAHRGVAADDRARIPRAAEARGRARLGAEEVAGTDADLHLDGLAEEATRARLIRATGRGTVQVVVARGRRGRGRGDGLARGRRRTHVVVGERPLLDGSRRGDGGIIDVLRERGRQAAPSLSPALRGALARYDWPGNFRQLRNALEHALIVKRGDVLQAEDLPLEVRGPAPSDEPASSKLDDVIRRHIHDVLAQVQGNRTRAAQVLGIDRATLRRRLGE
jgi:hypothetical protein